MYKLDAFFICFTGNNRIWLQTDWNKTLSSRLLRSMSSELASFACRDYRLRKTRRKTSETRSISMLTTNVNLKWRQPNENKWQTPNKRISRGSNHSSFVFVDCFIGNRRRTLNLQHFHAFAQPARQITRLSPAQVLCFCYTCYTDRSNHLWC